MIPPYAGDGTVSAAERSVFSMLDEIDEPPMVALHSLALSRHIYKRLAELDFVLVGTSTILVLEVKGGGVTRSDGLWHYTDRYGQDHTSSEGPFDQARSGMYSLRDRLIDRFSPTEVATVTFGYGVVLPDVDFDVKSPEWSGEMVIDGGALRQKGMSGALSSLEAFWLDKHGRRDRADGRTMARILDFLRPEFERIPSIVNIGDQLEREQVRLTDRQIQHLDIIADNDRILCDGGAGTGKTFIALETAYRHAAAGSSVLVTCRSPNLAAFLASRMRHPNIQVIAMDEIPEDQAPADVLIVDEGQDLMTQDRILRIGGFVNGDLDEGIWRVFVDTNNQSGLYGDFDTAALDVLLDANPTRMRLTENCRNTDAIVIQTKLLTGADLGTASFGAGPPVEWVYHDDQSSGVDVLERKIRELYASDVAPGNITILSPKGLEESAVASLPLDLLRDLHVVGRGPEFRWPVPKLSFSSIADFKGLENRHILVVDVDDIGNSPESRSELYVAMSRPRVSLWVALPSRLRSVKETVEMGNLEGVISDVDQR